MGKDAPTHPRAIYNGAPAVAYLVLVRVAKASTARQGAAGLTLDGVALHARLRAHMNACELLGHSCRDSAADLKKTRFCLPNERRLANENSRFN